MFMISAELQGIPGSAAFSINKALGKIFFIFPRTSGHKASTHSTEPHQNDPYMK